VNANGISEEQDEWIAGQNGGLNGAKGQMYPDQFKETFDRATKWFAHNTRGILQNGGLMACIV
jgi:hypothetical protein